MDEKKENVERLIDMFVLFSIFARGGYVMCYRAITHSDKAMLSERGRKSREINKGACVFIVLISL